MQSKMPLLGAWDDSGFSPVDGAIGWRNCRWKAHEGRARYQIWHLLFRTGRKNFIIILNKLPWTVSYWELVEEKSKRPGRTSWSYSVKIQRFC